METRTLLSYNLNGVEAAPVIVKPKQIESIENCPCSKCQVNFYGSFDNSSDDDDSYYDEVDYWFEERESSEVKVCQKIIRTIY